VACGLLERVAELQHTPVIAMTPDELKADR